LKLALDATYSVGRDLSGVGVYSREILTGLARAHPEATFLACFRPHRFWRGLFAPLPANCRRRLLRETWTARRADLFHGLNQRLPALGCRRSVATFHDLFVLTAEYSTPEFRERFTRQARQAAERADLIITVSAFTASEVERLLGVERSRLRVIEHGVRCVPPSGEPREKVVLHVGAIQHRKNVARLVEAFEHVPEGWRLVLAGSAGYGAEQILARIESSSRRADIDVLGYVTCRQLAGWYRRASIFAFPSLDEGFGMPVLEAMANGVPVLTSNRSALPEVTGDAALLVDPADAESITDGLRRLSGDEELRGALREKGYRHASQFTWETAVAKTWKVYRELLD
jgi:glycosyltransferase involved in cell wall biosynthesis